LVRTIETAALRILLLHLLEVRGPLDKDHYGLEKVKERIVVVPWLYRPASTYKAPILCLVGAPGVGKTSLGQSIARATNRSSCACRSAACATRRKSAARRTYTVRCRARSCRTCRGAGENPLFLLDEVDKMGADWRGDP